MTYLLSIEPKNGETFVHPFHLGTDLKVAKLEAEDRFRGRNRSGLHTRTVALIDADTKKIVDVFDGWWSSEYPLFWDQEGR